MHSLDQGATKLTLEGETVKNRFIACYMHGERVNSFKAIITCLREIRRAHRPNKCLHRKLDST